MLFTYIYIYVCEELHYVCRYIYKCIEYSGLKVYCMYSMYYVYCMYTDSVRYHSKWTTKD